MSVARAAGAAANSAVAAAKIIQYPRMPPVPKSLQPAPALKLKAVRYLVLLLRLRKAPRDSPGRRGVIVTSDRAVAGAGTLEFRCPRGCLVGLTV